MALAKLRSAGNSTILTLPAAVMDQALKDGLGIGKMLDVNYDPVERTIIMRASQPARPSYTMEQMLAECDLDAPMSEAERAWVDAPRVGQEAI